MQPRNTIVRIPELPPEILKALTPSDDIAINSAHQSVQRLNMLAAKLPSNYHWRFRTLEAFASEQEQMKRTARNVLPFNQLYWEDMLKNCEAYSMMSTWRVVELARSCVWALARHDLVCSALMARSALETTVQYVDFARTISATLERLPEVDVRWNLIISDDLEKYLLKTVFASRREGDDEYYKPTNIVTIINRIAKIDGHAMIGSYYETLCEVAHPNFLGRSLHIVEIRPGSRSGDEIRILAPSQVDLDLSVTRGTVGALSWACATQVTAFALMSTTIHDFLKRFRKLGIRVARHTPGP